MSRTKGALTLACLVLAIGCGGRDTYRPFYYPDRNNLVIYTRGHAFDSLAEARQWVEDQARQRRDTDWDYEIGLNCRPSSGDIEICEETLE